MSSSTTFQIPADMRLENGVVIDSRNNRADVEWFGSEEECVKALLSCYDCYDCSRCSGCSGCSGCYDCSGCSGCYDCSGCSGCYDCSRCSRCSDMSPQKSVINVPVIENIHRKIFDAVSQPGALCMSKWHTCETTHCRAGWVVTLAGQEGKALESQTSTLFAAQQIYRASGYEISPVRFFDSDSAAMEDMRRLAEQMN